MKSLHCVIHILRTEGYIWATETVVVKWLRSSPAGTVTLLRVFDVLPLCKPFYVTELHALCTMYLIILDDKEEF
jgi:hypothetical protein